MKRYVKACGNASGTSFQVIPCLEFRCRNRTHILGVGINKYFRTGGPVDAAEKIKVVHTHPIKYISNP